jgi:hypothetical protein
MPGRKIDQMVKYLNDLAPRSTSSNRPSKEKTTP